MTEHSFGCLSDQEAMGLHDLSKAQVHQKPKEMNEEELFCKLFPEYVVNGKPLSPYFDLFESGCEQAENRYEELEKENDLLKGRNEGFEQQIMGLLIKYEEVYKRFPDLKSAMDKAQTILKENAELKSRDCWKSCEYVNPKTELIGQHIKDVQNLTKAKEIIKYLLSFIQKENYRTRWDINIAEAEQFISEVEK